jgi:hypothetical protein
LPRDLALGPHGPAAAPRRGQARPGLVKAFLKAGILGEDGVTRNSSTGTPQGGILSPLLANVALSVLDDHFAEAWLPTDGDIALFSPSRVAITRYRFRGAAIPSPWEQASIGAGR